jgi:hypothetical protein
MNDQLQLISSKKMGDKMRSEPLLISVDYQGLTT